MGQKFLLKSLWNAGFGGLLLLAPIVLAVVMFSRPAAAYNCRVLFSAGDTGLGEWVTPAGETVDIIDCEEYDRDYDLFADFAGPIKIYAPPWWEESPHPDAPPDTMRTIATAVRETLIILGPDWRPYAINVVLLGSLYDEGVGDWGSSRTIAMADTKMAYDDGVCPVAVFIDGVVGQEPDRIKATIAHEIFHCVQIGYFPERTRHYLANAWWVEGTAVRFENYLYPCVNAEGTLSGRFDPAESLIRQAHHNATFFAYLETFPGHRLEQLIDFMSGMAALDSESEQFAALAGYPDSNYIMDKFARAYIDGHILDADRDGDEPDCSRPIPLPPLAKPTVNLSGSTQRLSVEVDPFAIASRRIVVPADKIYRISMESTGRDDGALMVSFRREDDPGGGDGATHAWTRVGEWRDADKLSGSCDEERAYLLAVTPTELQTSASTVRLLFEEEESSIPAGLRCTDCPVGAWRRAIGDLNMTVSRKVGSVRYHGYIGLRVFPGGAATIDYRQFTAAYSGSHSVSNGTTTGTWSLPGLLPGPIEPGTMPNMMEILERLGITSNEDVPTPNDTTEFDWTGRGVTVVSSITVVPPRTGQLGAFAPKGRYRFSCKGDDLFDTFGGGRYWREY